MITGEMKSKVDKLWEMFWTGGITNPLDVIEQITYLMFIRDLDDTDKTREKDGVMLELEHTSIFGEDEQGYRWSKFRDYPAQKMYEIVQMKVFPFIKDLHDDKSTYSKYMADAIFKIPTPQLLEKIVTAMDEMKVKRKTPKGDLYEYLLSKISTAGTNGQFRTPRHIIRMMVEMLDPKPRRHDLRSRLRNKQFLVSAGEYLRTTIQMTFLIKKRLHITTTICSMAMTWTELCCASAQ